MPGQSLIGSVATFDSSRVTWPEKPGSIQPAVECVSRPSRPRLDLPSSRPAMSSGSETTSKVDPSTNSPGCRTNGSSPSVCTRRVRSACSIAGSMCGYLWFSKTRKYRSSRTSTLDGWTSSGVYGSSATRPESIWARISLSERSTQATYRFRYDVGAEVVAARWFAGFCAGGCGDGPRGCSSMAEHQLPKLTVRVRFSSPALTRKPRAGRTAGVACDRLRRATSRPQRTRRLRGRRARTVDLSWRTCHISASYLFWAGDKPRSQMREPTYFVLESLLDGPLHGYAIIQRTEQLSGGRIKLATGTLYTALDRLTAEGHVELVREEIVNGRARPSSGLAPPRARG